MHIFISYAKADTRDLALQLREALNALPDVTAWLDTSLYSGEDWATQIQDEIDRADLVIVLLSQDVNRPANHPNGRSFVLKEIHYAQQVKKTIIPVMAQKTKIPVQLAGIEYIDFTHDSSAALQRLIHEIADRVGGSAPIREMVSTSSPAVRPTSTDNFRRPILVIGLFAIVLVVFAAIILPLINHPSIVTPTAVSNASTATSAIVLPPISTATSVITNTPMLIITAKLTDTLIPTRSFTDTPQQTNIFTPTFTPSLTMTLTPTNTFTITPTSTETPPDTSTPTPTIIPTTLPVWKPGDPVTRNGDWKPEYQTFNGFEMALVPVGCFMMGSADGEDDEKPVNKQCFDQPFWIDHFEVTNQQYGSEGNFKGANRPRESVTWIEARDFCAKRDAHLPTEREWEYAARGPDDLIYPWGDNLITEDAVYLDNSNDQTSDVGSRPAGNSWVGVSDLSGNVWEWVSSMYQSYPYKTDDGREINNIVIGVRRVLRGGAWNFNGKSLRAGFRYYNYPTNQNLNIGFRCARFQ